eukprot:TRINITY_DN2188_c0_g1_i1.p3 TRINITY_DN2188_c0_g1~~TRINITY_DN2188_c0_g1_i1.p3  ORF type:complete len:145 (-),score=8.59 TRINITY_DN2188_c0_g1_i1:326-760(-)
MILGFTVRARYYGSFKILETGAVISGCAFNGYDKETGAAKHYLMDVRSIELGVFFRSTVEQWNRHIHLWLEYCIHIRFNASTTLKVLTTFLLSAYWHGMYALYYIGFGYYAVATMNFNYLYKLFIKYKFLRRPFFHILLLYLVP